MKLKFYTGTVMSGKTKLLFDFVNLFNRHEIIVIVPKLVASTNSYIIKSRSSEYKNNSIRPDLFVDDGSDIYECVCKIINERRDNLNISGCKENSRENLYISSGTENSRENSQDGFKEISKDSFEENLYISDGTENSRENLYISGGKENSRDGFKENSKDSFEENSNNIKVSKENSNINGLNVCIDDTKENCNNIKVSEENIKNVAESSKYKNNLKSNITNKNNLNNNFNNNILTDNVESSKLNNNNIERYPSSLKTNTNIKNNINNTTNIKNNINNTTNIKNTTNINNTTNTNINNNTIKAIFIDEIQFLTIPQINILKKINSTLKIPIYTFGITHNHRNELFPTSEYLLSNSIVQYLSSKCYKCNKLANTNIRFDYMFSAGVVEPMNGEELFYPVCDYDWKKFIIK